MLNFLKGIASYFLPRHQTPYRPLPPVPPPEPKSSQVENEDEEEVTTCWDVSLTPESEWRLIAILHQLQHLDIVAPHVTTRQAELSLSYTMKSPVTKATTILVRTTMDRFGRLPSLHSITRLSPPRRPTPSKLLEITICGVAVTQPTLHPPMNYRVDITDRNHPWQTFPSQPHPQEEDSIWTEALVAKFPALQGRIKVVQLLNHSMIHPHLRVEKETKVLLAHHLPVLQPTPPVLPPTPPTPPKRWTSLKRHCTSRSRSPTRNRSPTRSPSRSPTRSRSPPKNRSPSRPPRPSRPSPPSQAPDNSALPVPSSTWTAAPTEAVSSTIEVVY